MPVNSFVEPEDVHSAIYGQESGYGANTSTSVTGAVGPGQIMPSTWLQYAAPGENIHNFNDNLAVSKRIVNDLYGRFGGDPARVAVAYFSGPGNVAPPGSRTPWIANKADPTGKTTASYVADVSGRIQRNMAKKLADADIDPIKAEGFKPSAPATAKASDKSTQSLGPLTDDEAEIDPIKAEGFAPAAAPTPSAPADTSTDFLANEPKDTEAAALAKGVGTTAIKAASHIPGAVGDIANLSDYLMARARAAYTGEPAEQVMAEHTARLNALAASDNPAAPAAKAYLAARAATPSGQDIASKVFGVTGEYKPTSDIGRNAMLAGEIAGTAGLMGVPTALPTVAGVGGNLISEATGEPLYGLAAGAALPMGARMASNALSAAGGALRPHVAQLADVAQNKWGIRLSPGQLSESPSVQRAAGFLNRLPGSGSEDFIAGQKADWHRALSSTMGENSPALTQDVMKAAKDKNGGLIGEIGRRNTIDADNKFSNDLVDTLTKARLAGLADHQMVPLNNIFDNIVDNIDSNGKISGEAYVNMTKYKTPLWNAQHNSDPNIKDWAGNIRDVLDDALERSAPPEEAAALRDARAKYRNMKILDEAVGKRGEVSPARLAQVVDRKTKNARKYGEAGDMGELATIGQDLLQEPQTSYTGEHNVLAGLMKAPLDVASLFGGRMVGNAFMRNPEIARAMINRSLGRPMGGESLINYLGRTTYPYALSAPAGSALQRGVFPTQP